MVPLAIGTDTAGSLRIPAAACGVSTLRSASGRVSRYGLLPLSRSFDIADPLARRMLDVSILTKILAGYDPRDHGSCDAAVPAYPLVARPRLNGTRIGVSAEMTWV